MDTPTKTGIDAAKTASKRVLQKTSEATTYLIRNTIVDKISSIGKPKGKETKKTEKTSIPPEKRQQIIHDLRLFWKMWHYCIRIEFQKIVTFNDGTIDNKGLPKFATKKLIEVYDQSEKKYHTNKKTGIKTSVLVHDLCDYSDSYIILKGTITVVRPNNSKRNKAVTFKNNAPFINCISKINGVKIDNAEDLDVVMPMYNLLEYSKNYEEKQVVYRIIIEMNQLILFLLILNLLNIKQVLQKILIILVMVKKGMIKIKLVKMKLKLLLHWNL